METTVRVLYASVLTIVFSSSGFSQGEAAVPFLGITSSPEGNGMGGIAASVVTDNAMAVISNPGQVGLFALRGHFNGGFYTRKTQWLPMFQQTDLTYKTGAVSAGFNVRHLVSLPFSVGVGAGYSRSVLELGTFVVTNPLNPSLVETVSAREEVNTYSVGIGIDYVVRFGLGLNFKRIVSGLPDITVWPPIPAEAKMAARDFGLLIQAPLTEIVFGSREPLSAFMPNTSPLMNISVGYVHSNHGGEVVYIDSLGGDPLPREAVIGLGVEMGLVFKAISQGWKVLSFTWARQAEDVLVRRPADGGFSYQSGLGDVQVFNNIFLGEQNGNAQLRKGWELNVGELLYVRGGSYAGPGYLIYSTSGFSVRSRGIFRLVEAFTGSEIKSPIVSFVADHIDVHFHQSTYRSKESPVDGTTFRGLNLTLDVL